MTGAHLRFSSPATSSTLMTSAPKSASSWPQDGPASTRLRSRTRMPEKALMSDAADGGGALLSPGLVRVLGILGLAERHEAIDVDLGSVVDIRNIEALGQRLLGQPCSERRQGGDVVGDLERPFHQL